MNERGYGFPANSVSEDECARRGSALSSESSFATGDTVSAPSRHASSSTTASILVFKTSLQVRTSVKHGRLWNVQQQAGQ